MNKPPRIASGAAPYPSSRDVPRWTDHYFNLSKGIVEKFGDVRVTYAVFMRRPVVSAPRLVLEWLDAMAASRGTTFDVELNFDEGRWVGAGEPMLYISGPFRHLVDLETIFLQARSDLRRRL